MCHVALLCCCLEGVLFGIISSPMTMSSATTDDSSIISESRRDSVISRDGGLCVLCGMDPVDVAHVVARESGNQRLVSETG
jgi:hypothetical protein